jgi:hypothetical protein
MAVDLKGKSYLTATQTFEIADFRLLQSLVIYVNSVLWLLHHVFVGSVADVSEVHAATLRMDVACTSETLATSPTTTQFGKLTSTLETVYDFGRVLYPEDYSESFLSQNYSVFGLCPPSGILGARKHISETGSVSVLR